MLATATITIMLPSGWMSLRRAGRKGALCKSKDLLTAATGEHTHTQPLIIGISIVYMHCSYTVECIANDTPFHCHQHIAIKYIGIQVMDFYEILESSGTK